jgi:hypothetical protein
MNKGRNVQGGALRDKKYFILAKGDRLKEIRDSIL